MASYRFQTDQAAAVEPCPALDASVKRKATHGRTRSLTSIAGRPTQEQERLSHNMPPKPRGLHCTILRGEPNAAIAVQSCQKSAKELRYYRSWSFRLSDRSCAATGVSSGLVIYLLNTNSVNELGAHWPRIDGGHVSCSCDICGCSSKNILIFLRVHAQAP